MPEPSNHVHTDPIDENRTELHRCLRILVVTLKVDQAPLAVLGKDFAAHLLLLAETRRAHAVVLGLQAPFRF